MILGPDMEMGAGRRHPPHPWNGNFLRKKRSRKTFCFLIHLSVLFSPENIMLCEMTPCFCIEAGPFTQGWGGLTAPIRKIY